MTEFNNLDQLKQKLDEYRPLAQQVVKNIHEDLILRWTYNSNAIEGNTLTLKETKVALEGITIGGKSMREHFEVINHKEAILFIEDLVQKEEVLSEWQIRSIHQLILKSIDDSYAGKYRDSNVIISGADHTPPDFSRLSEEMDSFIHWYRTDGQNLHPVERAAEVHVQFVKIHPFIDGNGRTSRLLMNLELIKSGYPPVVIPVSERLRYYEALDSAHTTGDMSLFLALTTEVVTQAFEPYWFALGIQSHR
ncbi:MAG: Fic family protein [Fibrobacterales bacterium]